MIEQDKINKWYQEQVMETAEEAEYRLTQFRHSGLNLVNKIRSTETVIDIGCGHNIFKKYIPTLVGIDPVYDAADYKIALQDFATDQKFNVAFCLGSIQNGNIADIEQQIGRVMDLLTPRARIHWRVNPGTGGSNLEKFPWTLEDHYNLAKKFGFTIVDHGWDTVVIPESICDRLYVEWAR